VQVVAAALEDVEAFLGEVAVLAERLPGGMICM